MSSLIQYFRTKSKKKNRRAVSLEDERQLSKGSPDSARTHQFLDRRRNLQSTNGVFPMPNTMPKSLSRSQTLPIRERSHSDTPPKLVRAHTMPARPNLLRTGASFNLFEICIEQERRLGNGNAAAAPFAVSNDLDESDNRSDLDSEDRIL